MPPREPTRYVYGVQIRAGGRWLWPRGCYEYELEKAKGAALRTWPHAAKIAVAIHPVSEATEAWLCERAPERTTGAEWILTKREEPAPPAHHAEPAERPRMWWQD